MKDSKKIAVFSRILYMCLLIIGIFLLGFFQYSDKKALCQTLEKTISFTKNRINSYDTYRTNDLVKSLVRLLDKTTELSRDMTEWETCDAAHLDSYADIQRLSGILVLDENLQPQVQTDVDGDGMQLWSDLINSAYVSDIIRYPLKTYTTRVTLNGTIYDFAAVSRKDASGIVICYLQKDPLCAENGDLIFDTLFADFPFDMDGVVVVCEDDVVLSSNEASLVGKTVQECSALYQGAFHIGSDQIVRLRSSHRIWYGKKDKTESYDIYMFFPGGRVYSKRNTICGIYILISILICLLYRLGQSRAEKADLEKSQKRLRIINAIGRAYTSISLVYLKTGKIEVVKGTSGGGRAAERPDFDNPTEELYRAENINALVADSFKESCREYWNMDTLAERLQGKRSLSHTFQTVEGVWLLSLIVPQRYDKSGNIEAVLIANRDVTAEKQREIEQDEALRNALANAEHANKAKTVFLNNMSHDIRTPMNAIIGFTALAVSHIDEREHVLDYLKKINTSGKHLLSLINDVLDMSRIENGSVKIENVDVHLPDVLHDLRAIMQGNIGAKQQDLYVDTQDVVHEDIITDKLRLNQVLLNILSNAVKFTPVGGSIYVRVTEKPCLRDGYATYEFRIKDTGIGIDKEFQEHIFDSFARERSVTESGIQGTGLGLAIAKNIVDMMNGTIVLNSEKGKGSEFIVTLDCRITGKPVQYEPIPALHGHRALVVDDNADTCMNICKMLRKIEMQADWTTTGKEAVMRAREAWEEGTSFAVYIIDWMMPDMNGIETVRRIRRVIGDDTPIIILTAYDWEDIEAEAREAGVTAFVAKPLFLSELQKVLNDPGLTQEKKQCETPSQKYAGKKILLAEDNELNREIAVAILEEAGFVVDTVNDGSDAVERMAGAFEDQYDLILMDIQMPKMDGYMATREIRTLSNNKKANIPIIAMTANAFEEDRRKAFEAGMNGHIAKPINIRTILQTLDEVLGDGYRTKQE